MAGDLVFITGTTGHVGLYVLLHALKAGYRVRASVRSLSKSSQILDAPSIKAINPSSETLSFVEVPDMLAPGAYDEALKGADYAIHIASPITSAYKEGDDVEKVFIEPAVKGTINFLEAAKKAGSIKRVSITSSVVAIMSGKAAEYNEKDRTTFVPPPYSDTFQAYSASKIKALNDAEAWVAKEKPGFDVVHLFPSFVEGWNELVTKPEDAYSGTNAVILGTVFTANDLGVKPGLTVFADDVGFAHVKALDKNVPGNQGYILNSGGAEGTKWEEAHEIVAREFKKEVEEGKIRNDGKIGSFQIKLDTRRSEEVLGIQFKGYDEQVKSVVAGYLRLL